MKWLEKIKDYIWKMVMKVKEMVIQEFEKKKIIKKNQFMEEIRKKYVKKEREKGMKEKKVIYRKVLRNEMMIVIEGFKGELI